MAISPCMALRDASSSPPIRLMLMPGTFISSETMGNELVMIFNRLIFFKCGHIVNTVLPQSIKIISPLFTCSAASLPMACLRSSLFPCFLLKLVKSKSSSFMAPPWVRVRKPSCERSSKSRLTVAGDMESF